MEGEEVDMNAMAQSLLEKLFNPKPHIDYVERTLNGEVLKGGQWIKTRKAIAGSEFISTTVMNLNGIINSNSLMSNFEEEADFYGMLIESVLVFLRAMLNEDTIRADNYMQIYLLYSNPLEMFARQVIGAHATETVKQILTNTYNELVKEKMKEKGFSLFQG